MPLTEAAKAKKKKRDDEAHQQAAKSIVNKTVKAADHANKAVSNNTRQPSVSQKTQSTVERLNQKYGRNQSQPSVSTVRKPSQTSPKTQKTVDRLNEKYGKGEVTGGKHTYMDDVADTAKSTLRQVAAEEARAFNASARTLTSKDSYLYASQAEIDAANKRADERDKKFRAKIKQESAEMEKLKNGHSYLGQQGLSAVSSAVGMATDAAWGPAALAHMFIRTQAGSEGNVKEKVEPLKQKLSASGNYSQEEIDEMFKDVDKWDLANSFFEGGIEVLSEKMFGGFGLAKRVGGSGILDKSLAKLGARMGSKATTGVLGRVAKGTAEEVAEEEVGNPLQTLASNLIYGNRMQNINEDATRRELQAQSDAIRSRIQTPEDAQAVATQLGSKEFMADSRNMYLESGMSEKEADELASMTRDYLEASALGDVDRMRELQDEMVKKLAGGENSLKEKWTLQDAIDAAVSTSLMTVTTGVPGAVTNSMMGKSYKDTNGMDAVKNLAKVTKNLDPEKSVRAQAIMDRIDAGEDISGTQVYDLIQWSSEAATESYKREDVKERMADSVMKRENLFVAPSVRNEDGSVTLGEETERRYDEILEENKAKAKAVKGISREDAEIAADVATAFQLGTITANQMNELSSDNLEVREAFHQITGINLNQFDTSVNQAENNIAMQESLFARAADNYIESARIEQEAWNDGARGEVESSITEGLGSNGDVAVHDALNAVDPRDRSTFILMGRASASVYDYARFSEDSWEDVSERLKSMYPSLPQDALKGVYESAKKDKKIAETPHYNAKVKATESTSKFDMSEAEQTEFGKFTNEAQRQLKDSEQIVLQSLAQQFNINIKLLPSKAFKIKSEGKDGKTKVSYSNGAYDPKTGTMILNGGNDMERNLIAVALHEITHHIATYAPEEYIKLSNRVMDRWYKNDSAAFKEAIQRKQAEYKKAVKQDLSEEQALEEIIADAVGEMNSDSKFIDQICREEPTLAEKIINAIKDVLRKLREILSSGRVSEEYEDAFFAQLDMWDEAQRLWMQAAKAAQKQRANQAIDDWDAKARQERSPISDSNISSYSTGAYSGQVNMRTEYKDDSGNVLGYVEWNDYEGTPSISYIHVDENSRRQGIATKLLQDIQRQYPDTEINFGMTTEDGTALVDAVTHEVVDEEFQTKQNDLSKKRQELEGVESRLNELYENDELSEEQDAEASELGARWDDLNREVHDLDEEIGSRSATKRMVNMPDTRFSITEDSSGKELTEGQKEFFKDSKIVDAEGRLKVMYHGTPNMGFTVFDRRKTRPGTLGRGFYFSDQDSHAGQYGARYEVYLNITQPLGTDTNDITKDQLRAFVEEIAEDEDYGLDNYGYGATVDSVVDDVWGKSDFRMMQDINLACVGDMAEAVKLFNSVNGTNYDGIVTDLETVAFYPEQIKNIDNENPTEDPDIRYSVTTDKEDFIKGANLSKELRDWAKEIGLDKLSKQPVKGPVIVSVRDLRTAWYQKNGREEEAQVINTVLDKIGDSLTQLVGKYQYIDLGDALNAAVTYRADAEGHPTSVILSCQVKNAEYEVNFDFTTICAKRLAMQKILERFIKTEGERQGTTLYDELKLDEEGLYKLRLILETAGFDVSCRGCFVEQNRYSQQNQARTIANDWNAALDEWAKDNGTEVTENFGLTTLDINNLDYEEIEAAFERYHELMKGQKTDVATKNRMLIESSPFFRKRMNASDYASMAGQRALMAIGESKKGGTNLYGLLKRGQSDSKQSVPFTAYNGEISLLPDNMKGKSLYDYLLSIGGARAQSASDFQIEFVYDYMQMVADLSARGLPMHMYTKVIELAELFGMTGIKINLSAMCDVADDLGGEYAGLKIVDGKYEYNISDQSIDYPKAVELQKKDGYSKNIGIIMVTLSSQHMLKSLDDPDVRYIIGYHSSAMPVVVANMSNMGGATDYTKINKTNKLNEKGKALFDEAMKEAKGKTALEKYKNALRIFDEKIQEETAKKKKKPRRGNEYGAYMSAYGNNTADFNTYDSLLETKDARKTADKYLEHCMKNDLIPIYFPFAFHENYYKCEVYDFNMYDNNTGEYAPMGSVQNIYPGLNMAAGETDTTAFTNRVSEMMDEQNRVNQSLDSQYDAVFDEAKDTLKFSITGDDYMDFDASGIEHSELTHRADAIKTEAQLRDEAYMAAVNSGNMEEAQRLVDEAARNAGMRVAHRYHGSMNSDFTVFSKAKAHVGGNSGAGFYFSTSKEDSEAHYADSEGADNYFKIQAFADYLMEFESEWNGREIDSDETAMEIAREELNKNPGMFDVYLNYKKPYVRDFKNSTNIYDDLYSNFDESVIDRDDYDDEDDYESDLYYYRTEDIAEQLSRAVYAAYGDLEDNYEVIDAPYVSDVVDKILEHAFDYESITWDDIQNAIFLAGETQVTRDDWTDSGDATPEYARAIIENLGYDAIEDKEVSNKFGQLSREMQTDTEHIIVFQPEQIKLSDPVTYAEDGSVIPLSERFDPTNDDIRYSLPTQDSDGNILTDGQMEYFKNSQARDEQGRLVPVYHTTPYAGFTVFDSQNSNDGRSLFFTNDRSVSASYSNASGALPTIFDPYEGTAPKRTVSNVENLPEDILFGDGLSRISNIKVMDRNGREIAAGDDFVNVAIEAGRYLESEGYDLYDDFDVDSYLTSDSTNMGNKRGEAMDLYRNLEEGNFRFTMDYSDQFATYAVYLNIENPLRIDADNSDWNEIPFNGESYNTRELAKLAQDQGLDGVIIENVVDYGDTENYGDRPADVYIAFNSNQVKDTRNTNPTNNPDIRYSIPDAEYVQDQMIASAKTLNDIPLNDALLEENRVRYSLSSKDFEKKIVAGWSERTLNLEKKTNRNPLKTSLIGLMKQVRKESETDRQYKTETLEATIKSIESMYEHARADNASAFAKEAWTAAERIVDDIDYNDDLYQQYKGIMGFFSRNKIAPGDLIGTQEFDEFAKENSGKIWFTYKPSNALEGNEYTISEFYSSLCSDYPSFFPKEIEHPIDQLMKMASVLKNTDAYRDAYTSEEHAKLVEDIANNLCNIVSEGDEYRATINDFKVKAMKQRHKEALNKVREERNKITEGQKMRADMWKQRYQDRIQRDKEKREETKERKVHTKLYNKILNEYNDLTRKLLNPSKDRDKNIPEQIRQPLAEMLACFDLEKARSKELEEQYMIPTRKQLNFRQLKDALEKVAKEEGVETEFDAYFNYIGEKITAVADKVDGKTIDFLDNEDLDTIEDMMKGLVAAINNWHQLEKDGESYRAQQICDEVGTGAAEHRKLYGKAKQYSGIREMLNTITNMGELTPIYFFRQLKGLYDMYRQIRKGFDQYVRNEKATIDKIAKILAPYYKTNRKGQRIAGSEIEEWRHSESAETFNLTYGPITLTIAQKMSLYCLYKRDQARMHMLSEKGGIVASETEPGSKIHKAQEALKGKNVQRDQVPLTPADAEMIIATLTEEQKTIADQLQDLMSNDMSELGNKASIKLIGIAMYREKNYFPINVEGDSRSTQLENINMREKVRNPGFSNPLKDNATNPIIIDDIFAVVASHCNEMNLYASYAVPLTNFMKVYNGSIIDEDGKTKRIKKVIRETYGDKAVQYIENFLDDINGNSFKRHGGLDDILDKALGQAKKAAVFANLRVALQQPTAIIRAAAVMNPKYFLGVKPSKKATAEMFEHCPIALWKSLGYYDTHFGRDIEDVMMGRNVSSKLDVIMSDAYGALDNMTWGMIWQAVKNEVRESHKGIDENSQEFWDLCNDRASFVFDSTQVVDSPLHRSNDMRSKNGLVKQLTSFQAEPTLSFNVLRQGIVDTYEALKKGDKAKAGEVAGRVVMVWATQAAFVALAQTIVDALRRKGKKDGDDDEDDALTWYEEFMKYFIKNYLPNFVDDVNAINNVYYVKEIVPGILNALLGEYVYGQQNLTFQWVDTLTNGITKVRKLWTKGESDPEKWYDAVTELFGGIGYRFGLPIKTGMRGTKNFLHWFNKFTGMNVLAADGTVSRAFTDAIENIGNQDGSNESSTATEDGSSTRMSSIRIAGVRDGSTIDNVLNHFGVNLTDDEIRQREAAKAQAEYQKRVDKITNSLSEYSGEEYDKHLWDKSDLEGYGKAIADGDFKRAEEIEQMFIDCGGSQEFIDEKKLYHYNRNYVKTIVYDPTDEQVEQQQEMKEFLLSHGVSEAELSEKVYKSQTRKELQVAFRLNDEDAIIEELEPLIRAGLSYDDFVKAYDNRNRVDFKKYKDGGGKYADRLKSTGRYNWPITGQITSNFGHRSSPGGIGSTYHQGLDIAGSMGDPVGAADGGTVVYAGWYGGAGKTVMIEHDDGTVTQYSHLSWYDAKVGDVVGQGQTVGNVGSTGNSTGPHLHFAVKVNGKYVDPITYLKG